MPESGQGTLSEELTGLLQEVLSQWTGAFPRLVYVTDCGFHPTEYFEKTLSRMEDPRRPGTRLAWQWIVDYYHACQYITKLAAAIFGPGRHASALARRQRRVLKEEQGGIYRVLRTAGALLHNRGPVGTEESYELAYAFLRERTAKMDYPTYRRLPLPIGSGVTEAACKILFTQRFKQSGLKWSVDGGKGLSRNEKLIVILYYYEELTMKEIGATLDLSESRVSQLHTSIVQRLATGPAAPRFCGLRREEFSDQRIQDADGGGNLRCSALRGTSLPFNTLRDLASRLASAPGSPKTWFTNMSRQLQGDDVYFSVLENFHAEDVLGHASGQETLQLQE